MVVDFPLTSWMILVITLGRREPQSCRRFLTTREKISSSLARLKSRSSPSPRGMILFDGRKAQFARGVGSTVLLHSTLSLSDAATNFGASTRDRNTTHPDDGCTSRRNNNGGTNPG
jgi:hypothetical protein